MPEVSGFDYWLDEYNDLVALNTYLLTKLLQLVSLTKTENIKEG